MNNEILVKSIKKICQENNISVSQLETDLKFSPSLISRWKDKTPSLDKIVDIADYFHVSLDEVVGYELNLHDGFMKELYERTCKGNVIWNAVKNNTILYPKIKLYNKYKYEFHPQYYDEETYGEIHYATHYDKGYIIIYAFYKYEDILKPAEIKLFIQPTEDSFLVEQNYPMDVLLKLWVKILNSLGDDTPDVVKAEDFKNNFINTPENLNDEKITEFLKDPSILKLIETVDTKEFIKVQQIFEDPNFKSALQMLNEIQNYLDSKG